ncbi:MAG: hypothetical protein RLZZ623_721, partial [Actinomycetota bacterium]
AYAIASVWSLYVMSYKVPGFSVAAVAAGVWKMALAAVVMAEGMWLVADLIGSNTGMGALVRVTGAGLIGVAAYVALLTVMQVPELQEVRTRVAARFA